MGADTLEKYITSGINRWYTSRKTMDFLDAATKKPLEEVKNVKRWLSHVLLTTTVNMTAARQDNSGDHSQEQYIFPQDHFYNEDLFGSTSATGIQVSSLDIVPDQGSVLIIALAFLRTQRARFLRKCV